MRKKTVAPDKRIVAIGAFQNSSNGYKAIGKKHQGLGLVNHLEPIFCCCEKNRWWFQSFFIFTPILGERIQFDDHIFQLVETTNEKTWSPTKQKKKQLHS